VEFHNLFQKHLMKHEQKQRNAFSTATEHVKYLKFACKSRPTFLKLEMHFI